MSAAQRRRQAPKLERGKSAKYFTNQKKGEVNELMQLMKNPSVMKDPKRLRDVIKKVIAYMTLGIDVSLLFSQMAMLGAKRDVVVKKMVYQYLTYYAEQQPDLAIMCINTLQRDCQDDDPMIRGMALRSLTSLKLASVVEYLVNPVRKGLKDKSGYVRKTAIMGVLKLHHVSPETVQEAEFVDVMYDMLRDQEMTVVANAICALTEVMADEGGMAINKPIAHHVLNHIKEFNAWGQCIVLGLVAKYKPEDNQEIFNIMNLLEGCLSVSNASVVVAAAKCFIEFGQRLGSEIEKQIYMRLKTPLLTLMTVPSPEADFCVLTHIKVLQQRCNTMFNKEYKLFFLKYNEASYIKYTKLDVLPMLANEENAMDLIAELSEYVSNIDPQVVKRAIQGIGQIGVSVASSADKVVEQLLEFGDLTAEVQSETVVVLKDVLRVYPRRAADVIPSLHSALKKMESTRGRAAVIWMLGEYGEKIEAGPYLLEPYLQNLQEQEDKGLRLECLTAAMKLFFKRPPEVQKMLGVALQSAIDEDTDSDVRDRGMFYYRLLKENTAKAKDVVLCAKKTVQGFYDGTNQETRDKIFAEFNTLSVPYDAPADTFISKHFKVGIIHDTDGGDDEEENGVEDQGGGDAMDGDLLGGGMGDSGGGGGGGGGGDLLDFGGFGDDSGPSLELDPSAKVGSKEFQGIWGKAVANQKATWRMSLGKLKQFEPTCKAANIFKMASGATPTHFKVFMFAKATDGEVFLAQLMVSKKSGEMNVLAKGTGSRLEEFMENFGNTVATLQ